MQKHLTIKTLMENNCFKNSIIVAGKKGIVNIANNVVILETPNGMKWLQGNEIVVTAGHAFINNQDYKKNIIRDAYAGNAAAVFIKLGRYYGEIDNSLIEDGDKYNIPIFIMDKTVNYTELVNTFYEQLFNIKNENLLEMNKAYNRLLNLQIDEVTIEGIVKELESMTDMEVTYSRFYGYLEFSENIKYLPISKTEDLGYLIINSEVVLNDFQKNTIKYAISLLKSKLLLEQDFLYSISETNRIVTHLLLTNHNYNARFYDGVLRHLKWENSNYYAINFRWKAERSTVNSEIRKFIEYICKERFLFNSESNEMTVYLPYTKDKLERLLKKIITKFSKNTQLFKIGVSKYKSSFQEMQKAHEEAKRINNTSNKDYLFIEDFPGEEIILEIVNSGLMKERYDKIISELQAYDNAHGTNFLDTLFCYIENNLDRNKTSDILHIHIETLRYRLSRIQEISGYDISKSKDLLTVMLALEFHKYL